MTHPITLPRWRYAWGDEAGLRRAQEHNQEIEKLETYVNDLITENGEGRYLFSSIAHATGLPVETVRKYFGLVCIGSNGFMVHPPTPQDSRYRLSD